MRWLSLLLILHFAFYVEPAAAVAQQEAAEKAAEEVADVVSGFLKSLVKGKKRKRGRKVVDAPAAAAQVFRAVRVNNPPLAKKKLVIRKERLDAYFVAFASWVDVVCDLSDEQKKQLSVAIKQGIDKSQKLSGKAMPGNNNGNQYFYDYTPVNFIAPRGAAWGVYQGSVQKSLLELLNADQKKKFQVALTKRNQDLHDRFFDYVMGKADKELFFSTKQKEQITNLFPARLPLLQSGIYSFAPQTYYLPQKSIAKIIMHPPLSLKKVQMERLQDLKMSQQSSVSFMAMDGLSGWHKKLKQISVEKQKELHRVLNIRIAYYAEEAQLGPKQKRYLEVAGKGASVKAIAKWKKQTIKSFASWERTVKQNPGQNFGFGVNQIKSSELDQHPLWKYALQKVLASSYEQRKNKLSKNVNGYTAAMLGQELWLSIEQRQEIENLLVDPFAGIQQMGHGRFELILIGVTVHGKKRKAIEAILNEAQLNAFATLRAQYFKQNNYLMMNYRHGQMHLRHMPN